MTGLEINRNTVAQRWNLICERHMWQQYAIKENWQVYNLQWFFVHQWELLIRVRIMVCSFMWEVRTWNKGHLSKQVISNVQWSVKCEYLNSRKEIVYCAGNRALHHRSDARILHFSHILPYSAMREFCILATFCLTVLNTWILHFSHILPYSGIHELCILVTFCPTVQSVNSAF